MAAYIDEAEVWKCPTHPSRRRRNGICPTCLRERLVTLCPDCANARPCACSPAPTESSLSSSSSSSFSLFSFSRGGSRRDFAMSSAVTAEPSDPAFRRSRSVAFPFLRSKSRHVGAVEAGRGGCVEGSVTENNKPLPKVSRSTINFWSVFKLNKSNKCDVHGDGINDESNKSDDSAAADDYSRMLRSRSVAVGAGDRFSAATAKRRGWYFPSPIKAFRQSKTSKPVTVA